MQYIKEQIEKGNLELAKMNSENKPIPMDYSELQEKQTTLNKRALLLQKLKTLSREEKEEWRHIKKLKANELYKNQKVQQAIELYLQALLGLNIGEDKDESTRRDDNEFKYSILLNIATCLYKLKEYDRGVEMCNKILEEEDGKTITKAYFKKANLLLAASKYDQSKQTCLKALKVIQTQKQSPGITNIDKNDFLRLLTEIERKTTKEKSMYQKMFIDSDDEEDSLLNKNGEKKQKNERVLYYNDSLWSKILDCCSSTFKWAGSITRRNSQEKKEN